MTVQTYRDDVDRLCAAIDGGRTRAGSEAGGL
jgi:hypothetical protein